jgi:site-specific DNA-methyltransferase (adenine-specific)
MMDELRGCEDRKENISMGTSATQYALSLQELRKSSTVEVLPPSDVLATLIASPSVEAVILDPWYNKGIGGERDDYHDWLERLISEACRISNHVFVWGFPEILAYQIPNIPKGFVLVSWLTWFYKNCPSVIRGWRSAQNTCLHLAGQDAPTYPEHFLNDDQLKRWKAGKMRFIPGPPSVIEAPLNIGFVGRSEQTGHPAQKPLAVIEPLLLMSTKEHDTVLDPMCGSGTTGEACLRLNRHAILCDNSTEYLTVTRNRLAKYWNASNGR